MVLRKVNEFSEEKPQFRLFFLKNDEAQSVEIEEVEEIDFREVERRLKQGESVFITLKPLKRKEKSNTSLVAAENSTEPWYFFHT